MVQGVVSGGGGGDHGATVGLKLLDGGNGDSAGVTLGRWGTGLGAMFFGFV